MIDRKRLRELAAKSTQVVSWYPRSQYDGGPNEGRASVRGPYGRWFMVLECREGDPVADPYDDAQYAAAAMNDLPALLDTLERYEKALESIFEHHIVWPTHDSQTLVKFAREALNPKEGV